MSRIEINVGPGLHADFGALAGQKVGENSETFLHLTVDFATIPVQHEGDFEIGQSGMPGRREGQSPGGRIHLLRPCHDIQCDRQILRAARNRSEHQEVGEGH